MYEVDDEQPIYTRLDKILIVIVGFLFSLIVICCFCSYELYSFFNP
jgi:hypothetical protein